MLGYDELNRDCCKILTAPEGKILSRKDVILDIDYLRCCQLVVIDAVESRPEY
jgi:hypothetical protein